MTTPELNGEWRNLIDARLDQIERVLLRVDVSYSERRHIVGEVEAQIFELLARRSENPTREDVQAVLDSLDPAEAYIPEELRGKFAEGAAAGALGAAPRRPSGPRVSRLAIGSAAFTAGLFLVGLICLACSRPRDYGEIFAIFGMALAVSTLCGLVACFRILLSEGRLRGLLLALFATGVLPLALVNFVVLALMVGTSPVIPWLITGGALLYLNYVGVRRFYRWMSSRQASVAEMLRAVVSQMRPAGSEARAT